LFIPKVLFGTGNKGKLREVIVRLAGTVIVLGLEDFPQVLKPPELGTTFAENARSKALYYSMALAKHLEHGTMVLAEDAGLEVFSLGGFPGVNSSRIAPTDLERMAIILTKLREAGCLDEESRAARFVSAMALVRGSDILAEAQGEVRGVIAPRPSGNGGFGYDPIFYFPPYGCTFGECSLDKKSPISHRAKALQLIAEYLAR
jgi:XTP/dITP diphosphohydrolase